MNGTYLRIYDVNDGVVVCVPEDEPRLDAAVTDYVDSGCTRDRVVDLTLREGVSYKLRASQVASWFVSTPESRRERASIDAEDQRESEGYKHELGIWDEA